MKSSQLVIAALLLAVLCSSTLGQNSNLPSECCFSYYPKLIPKRLIEQYENTRSDCSQPGVILISLKKIRICANPSVQWVKDIMNRLNEKLLQ
ncbi:C-C motif chemokine 4 homolog [Amia ocellicauda]|uniref:C-C motif chemokine 4 homolog n=1 Tax=Amia ocellicauda TaxID=2972642 RepID=UPI003463FB12